MTKHFLLLLLVCTGGCSRGVVQVKQDFADAYEGIKADLEFHEDEGLESFDPTAAATVRQMRKEMQQ
jgi:hypothetical protein